jgi:hypothetical protein
LQVRDGEKGPVEIEIVRRQVQTRMARKRTSPEEWLVVTRRPLTDTRPFEAKASRDATDQDARYRYHYYLSPMCVSERELEAPSLEEWHHHVALSLLAVWFLIGETHRGQQFTPALTLPQVRYGLSVLLMAVFCPLRVDYICRQVQRQLRRNELARFYHHRIRKRMSPRKLRL